MSKLSISFGEKIRDLRKSHGLTQKDLAKATGISPLTMFNIEKGKKETTLGVIERLAQQLGVSPSDLLSDVSPDPICEKASRFATKSKEHRKLLDQFLESMMDDEIPEESSLAPTQEQKARKKLN